MASGVREGRATQGAEGARLGQELGLSCTEYFSQGRSDRAKRCKKLLDICGVCSWNDDQIGRVQVSSADCLNTFWLPPLVENGKSGKNNVNHRDKDYCNI